MIDISDISEKMCSKTVISLYIVPANDPDSLNTVCLLIGSMSEVAASFLKLLGEES
jgi:hypothetical protein